MCNSKVENESPAFAGIDPLHGAFTDPITSTLDRLHSHPESAYNAPGNFLGFVSIFTRIGKIESEIECEARGEDMGPRTHYSPQSLDPPEGGIRIDALYYNGIDVMPLLSDRQIEEAEETLMRGE